MILHIAGQQMDGIAIASDNLPNGFRLTEDNRVEDVSTGTSTFTFTVLYNFNADVNDPYSRTKAAEAFKVGNHIIKRNGSGARTDDQVYTIINTEEDLNQGSITVESEDLGLDLLNDILPAEEEVTGTAADFMAKALANSGYEFYNDCTLGIPAKTLTFNEETAQSRILNIAAAYGVEISFSYQFEGVNVRKKYISFVQHRGESNGVQLHMNTDIRNITVTHDISDLVTGLEVHGQNEVGDDLTLDGYNYDDGDIFIRGTQLRSRSARQKWTRFLVGQNSEGYLIGSWSYNTKVKDQSELCDAAVKYFKTVYDEKILYDVDL